MKLLLFDIDGTLIRSNGAGREVLGLALEEIFGTAGPLENYQMSGKIDPRIILDLMAVAGFLTHDVQAKLPEIYDRMGKHGRQIFSQRGITVCAGVPDLLNALRLRSDIVLGLLTGNAQVTAPLKLIAAGLDPAQFKVGVYGSDALDRNDLPAIGIERANQLTGYEFNGYNTTIIGDTPADILCARAGSATAVAVASGWHSESTLAKYQPDHLFENLADTDTVIKTLLNE